MSRRRREKNKVRGECVKRKRKGDSPYLRERKISEMRDCFKRRDRVYQTLCSLDQRDVPWLPVSLMQVRFPTPCSIAAINRPKDGVD